MKNYRHLWAIEGAPTLLVGGIVARVGQGVTVVAWLLLIRQTRGSFSEAAVVTSIIALTTALAAPIVGRMADRLSASRVLPWCTILYVASQLGLLAAVLTDAPIAMLMAIAAVTGAAFPPVSAALRATWSMVTAPETEHGGLQRTAMAAESALFELAFVLGPLLLSGSILASAAVAPGSQTAGPTTALLVAAFCTLVGTMWVARGRAMRAARPQPAAGPQHRWGPLQSKGFPLLLGTAAGVMFAFGAAPVAIAAYAEQAHGGSGGSVTGILIAVWSLGSAAAGLTFGLLTITAPLHRQYALLLVGLTGGYVLWLAAPTTSLLAMALFLTGGVIAPALAVMAGLVAELTPASMRNEAYTWLTTTSMGISALGAAVAGFVVDSSVGASGGFLLAALATAAGLALTPWLRRSAATRDPTPVKVA